MEQSGISHLGDKVQINRPVIIMLAAVLSMSRVLL